MRCHAVLFLFFKHNGLPGQFDLVFIKRSGVCVFLQVPGTSPSDDGGEMDVLFARFHLTGAYNLDDSHFTAAGNGSFLPVTQHVGAVGREYHSAGIPETPLLFAVSLCGLCAAFCPFVVQTLNKNYNRAL